MKRTVRIYGLYIKTKDETWHEKCKIAANNIAEVLAMVGGIFKRRKSGTCMSSTNPNELHVCGTLRIPRHLFREPNNIDLALSGPFAMNLCYSSGPLGLAYGPDYKTEYDEDFVLLVKEFDIPNARRTK